MLLLRGDSIHPYRNFSGAWPPFFSVFNSIQLFGVVLLGGLLSGELARRVLALPRTTGFVVFGLLIGQSGLGWVTPLHIEGAQLFVDLALGLILFELGYLVPVASLSLLLLRLRAALLISAGVFAGVAGLLYGLGFALPSALLAATLCVATSPAITIATTADVGARGERTDLLLTLVALNGAIAFAGVAWATPLLAESAGLRVLLSAWELGKVLLASVVLGGACAGLVLLGADRLGRQPEHQHLLILGSIVLGVGTAMYLEISVLLPMLLFGMMTRTFDAERQVVAIRIASDARIFLVMTFVLAGAALDLGLLFEYSGLALLVIAVRLLCQFAGMLLVRHRLGLPWRDALAMLLALQPMSSVALVLLGSLQEVYQMASSELPGVLLATILLLQLAGPLCTQIAIRMFGEAALFKGTPAPDKPGV